MKTKVIGIGLNKTATKTLSHCLKALGYDNQSYSLDAFQLYQKRDFDALFTEMDKFDSFEDWPWPLMYKEIDAHYPDAKFILTTRKSPETWYRSLCKMAVRMGPLSDFEKHIYGHAMPHGHKSEHIEQYNQHNSEVRAYFADRPGKLLELCFDNGVDMQSITSFLGEPDSDFIPPHINQSMPVYGGDSLWYAQVYRVCFQTRWRIQLFGKRLVKRVARRLAGGSGY